jgi:lysophospholipase L1-like esterase
MADGRRRIAAGEVALAAASVLVALLLAEGVLRAIDFMPDYWDWHGTLVELDPELLYRLQGHSRDDLNALGYRDREFDVPKDGRTRIVMVGDSFLFGDNVGPEQTLPRQLERVLGDGAQVFNLGIAGDGPDQSFGRLRRDGLRLDPDAVILQLYPANDFHDLEKNRLYVFDEQGALVFNHDNPVAHAIPGLRLGVLLRKLFTGRGLAPAVEQELNAVLGFDPPRIILDPGGEEAAAQIALMRGVLRLFRDTLADAGIPFYVVIIPTLEAIQDDSAFREAGIPRQRYLSNERLAEQVAREEGVPVLALDRAFLAARRRDLYTPDDGHLSAIGTRVAARELARFLGQRGLRVANPRSG